MNSCPTSFSTVSQSDGATILYLITEGLAA